MSELYVIKYLVALAVTIGLGVWRKIDGNSSPAEFTTALFTCMGVYWLFELIVSAI